MSIIRKGTKYVTSRLYKLIIGKSFWDLYSKRPTLPLYRDFSSLFLLIPIFWYVKKAIIDRLLRKVGKNFIRSVESICSKGTDKDDDDESTKGEVTKSVEEIEIEVKNKLRKFIREGWELLNHTVSVCWCLIYFTKREWWYPNQKKLWSVDPMNKPLEFQFKLFYVYQILFYTQLTMEMVYKKAFNDIPMFLHHIFTSFLLLTSYFRGYADMGVLIIVLHDISDIFVSITKMLNYARLRRLSELVLFPIMLFSWFLFKLYYFPVYIIYSVLFESRAFLNFHWPKDSILHHIDYSVLIALYFLHIWWFYKFLKLFKKILIRNFNKLDKKDLIINCCSSCLGVIRMLVKDMQEVLDENVTY